MPKTYRNIIRKCNVELHYKDGKTVDVIMNLDLNASIDDQICDRFGEDNLKKWWWHEVNGPTNSELRDMLFSEI